MSGSDGRNERLRQTGCGECIAGILGALLTAVVLIVAGVSQFLFVATGAAFFVVGGSFAAWLHAKKTDRR